MVVVCPMSEIEKIVTALTDFPVDVLFLPNIEMPKTAYRNIIQSNTTYTRDAVACRRAAFPLPSEFDLVFRLSRGTSVVTAPHPLWLQS